VKNKTFTALLAGSTLWCLAIVAAPLFGWTGLYDFFSRICHQHLSRSWFIGSEPLPVCIRCTSIYFAFTASLWLGLKSNVRWLRISLALILFEFVFARLVVDLALLRSLTGVLAGMSAAPFVKRGVEEIREAM
jgi:uncharacterized membrane protein